MAFKIINIGMNHETAPVELRECLSSEPDNIGRALSTMRDVSCIREGFFLSTCNRIEGLVVAEDGTEARKSLVSLMSEIGNIGEEKLIPSLYTYEGMDAVREIRRSYDLGLRGIAIRPFMFGIPPHHRKMYPLYTACAELGMPIWFHLSINYSTQTMEVERTPGWHEVVWDGTDDGGRVQATGMYVTRLVVGAMVETQKMTMLK